MHGITCRRCLSLQLAHFSRMTAIRLTHWNAIPFRVAAILVVVFGLQWESVTRKYEWNSLDIFIVWNSSCDKNNFLLSRESRFLFLSLSVFSLGAALSALFLLRYYVTSQNCDMLFSHWTEDSPITILFSAILSLAFTHTHDTCMHLAI